MFMTTLEEKKIEGLKRLNYMVQRGMEFKKPIELFKRDKVGIFENLGGFSRAVFYDLYLNESDEEYKEMIEAKEQFEKEYNALVYLIQISHTGFGKCVSMFYVCDQKEEWEMDWDDLKNNIACVNVYNQTYQESEIGSIGFAYDGLCGGIYRTA